MTPASQPSVTPRCPNGHRIIARGTVTGRLRCELLAHWRVTPDGELVSDVPCRRVVVPRAELRREPEPCQHCGCPTPGGHR